jgi:RimJ/RimL family protein N-acetyltransferase
LTGPRLAIDHADPAEAVPPRLECHPLTMDESLALRPVREDDLAMFDSLVLDPAIIGEFGWFGWFDLRRWRRGWEENQLLGPDGEKAGFTREGVQRGIGWRDGAWRDAVAYSLLRTDPPV